MIVESQSKARRAQGWLSSVSLEVKALLAVFALTLSSYAAVAAASDLGLLANYYQDCPASHGPHAAYLQSVIRRALHGDEAAMRLLIMHKDFLHWRQRGLQRSSRGTIADSWRCSICCVRDRSVSRSPRCSAGFTSCAHARFPAHVPENCKVVPNMDRKSASHF